ncbi:hypothetical protein NJB14192_24220 [Mycobacterium montefiorense]|nr:hypothetical protein NJB14192_24220 [Mycobacterium montefiorense]
MAVDRQRGGLYFAQSQVCGLGVLPAQHHLYQRVVSQGPDRVEAFDEDLEGHVLMFVGGEAALADLSQQVCDGWVAAHVEAQHQGVDEKAHQLIECGVASSRYREPDGHI